MGGKISCDKTVDDCTLENTRPFELRDMRVRAKIIDVYDGDTVTAAFDTLGAGIYSHRIRLLGIDTPEIRTKNAEEKVAGFEARDYMREQVLGKVVLLHIKGTDKFGRVLATIFLNDVNINEQMVTGGHARVYTGGKREPWDFTSETKTTC